MTIVPDMPKKTFGRHLLSIGVSGVRAKIDLDIFTAGCNVPAATWNRTVPWRWTSGTTAGGQGVGVLLIPTGPP